MTDNMPLELASHDVLLVRVEKPVFAGKGAESAPAAAKPAVAK